MQQSRIIIRNLSDVIPLKTSHNIGLKSVLLSNEETISNITQIAYFELKEGEKADSHIHQTMDEHYLFISGKGIMCVDNEEIECKEGVFVLVPAKSSHSLEAISNLKFIAIGVAL